MSGSGLHGTLQSMGFPDLLQWVGQARKTGALVIDKGPVRKKIFFQNGTIVSSASNDPREYLGQFLLRHRLISEDQLRAAMEAQRKTGQLLGRVLLDNQMIKEDQLMRLLRLKAEETIYSLFLWEEGHFQFNEDETIEKDVVSMELEVETVLLEGVRRYDTLRKIRENFPSDGTILKKTASRPSNETISHPMAARLYELVDGNRSIADICLESHAPEFSVSLVLHQLYEDGHLALSDGLRKKTPSRGEAIVVLVEQAKGMLEKGNFEPALVLLEQIRDENAHNPEIPHLIEKAERGFVDQAYRHWLPPNKIPVLTRSLESLITEQFTPEEGYLVTRMNGAWDVESIVSISPMREVEVLRILKRLREKLIIQLNDPPETAAG
jgi:hypothetical protein